jgi:nucleotide-binding universal stress UspA family protein
MYKHILIPTDGSDTADKAVQAGIQFAREAKAKVTWFTAVPEYEMPTQAEIMSRHHVVTPDEHELRSRDAAEAIFGGIAERAREAGIEFDTDYVQSDEPYRAIIEAARRHGCDLIFMSSHGRHGLSALMHGSQTQDVLSHSTIPTLVYR